MKPITLEEIDKKKKNIAQSLDQLNLEKRKVERAEKEMFELHRQSLKPLRQILTLPISSKDYQVYAVLFVLALVHVFQADLLKAVHNGLHVGESVRSHMVVAEIVDVERFGMDLVHGTRGVCDGLSGRRIREWKKWTL